jgi:hypothetical protein
MACSMHHSDEKDKCNQPVTLIIDGAPWCSIHGPLQAGILSQQIIDGRRCHVFVERVR